MTNDSASHNEKYNEVNGEGNWDGESNNCLRNRGAEGFINTCDANEPCQCQTCNTPLISSSSQGTLTTRGGDEAVCIQQGNNNVHRQDNETLRIDRNSDKNQEESSVPALKSTYPCPEYLASYCCCPPIGCELGDDLNMTLQAERPDYIGLTTDTDDRQNIYVPLTTTHSNGLDTFEADRHGNWTADNDPTSTPNVYHELTTPISLDECHGCKRQSAADMYNLNGLESSHEVGPTTIVQLCSPSTSTSVKKFKKFTGSQLD